MESLSLLTLLSPLLLRWYPALLQTDHGSFSCVTVPDQIPVSNLTASHFSAPYNVCRFYCFTLGGQSHFPAFPMPSSLGEHFPIAVKCSQSLPGYSHLRAESKLRSKFMGKKVPGCTVRTASIRHQSVTELLREIQVFTKFYIYFRLPQQSSCPREEIVSNLHHGKGHLQEISSGAQNLISPLG